jgi:DNA-binding Xre family transcriptional regulator
MIRLNINSYLEQQNITAYRLIKESGLAPNTVYTLARTPAKRIDLDTLESIVKALTRLTGKPVTPNDLLEVIEEPEPLEETIPEEAWLSDSAASLKTALVQIEANEDPAQVRQWVTAFQQVAQ